MTMNDPLAAVLSSIQNTEQIGKDEVIVRPVSKVITGVFQIMHDNHYIGEFKKTQDNKGGLIKVHLLGKINKCCVIKPRFAVGKEGYEKFEKRYLPAKGFGILIVSTPKGLMIQDEAKKNNFGGRLIAYCY